MNKIRISKQPASRISVSRLIPACLFAGWCLLAASSCTLDEVEEGRGSNGGDGGEKIETEFSLSILPESAPGTVNATRAGGLTTVQEKTLTNLCVAQYNNKGVQTSKPVYYEKPTYTTNEAGDTLALSLMLDDNKGKNTVYLLANIGDKAAALAGKTEEEFRALTLNASSVFTADGMPLNDRCVLVGTWTGTLNDTEKKIPLTRAVAKISFSYEVAAGDVGFAFEATGLRLCNVPGQMPYIEPKGQLPKIGYTEYVTTALTPTSDSPCCWYLPENLAGTVTSDSAVYSDKEKVGAGVSNATYIELTGNVTQSSVSYPGVVFKLYPGNLGTAKEGYNDYNVTRNSHHVIHVKLMGIDFSDKRFTLGKSISMVSPDTLACGIGEETASLQIVPVQPGTTWSFLLPDWLSACITYNEGGATTTVQPLQNVSYHGAASLQFTTTTVNPNVTPRDYQFKIDTAVVTLTQDTAPFWVYPQELMLANTDAEQSLTINAFEGLPWTVSKRGGSDSINIASETHRYVGTQSIAFKAIKNDTDIRSASFTLATAGSFPARELVLTVHQDRKALPLVTVDKSAANQYAYRLGAIPGASLTAYPPFNHDGGNINSGGADLHKEEVENGPGYMIWVESGQNSTKMVYANAIAYCADLREGGATNWRVPTGVELAAVYVVIDKIAAEAGMEPILLRDELWTASVCRNVGGVAQPDTRVSLGYGKNGDFRVYGTKVYASVLVRCVRDY